MNLATMPNVAFEPKQQTASPLTATTVVMIPDIRDITLWLTPAGAIAALTVELPLDVVTRIGQRITVKSSQAIAALTIAGPAADGTTTVYGTGAALAVGGFVQVEKQGVKTWA